MKLSERVKNLLNEANLYFILAKRYEYVDPQRHMYYYQLYFNTVMELERHLELDMMGKGSHNKMHSQNQMYYY
ncbi:hypothetical protein [Tenuibacillus multivorans]|uniref:HEPN domain-containing protein n=1 Tax=Tenuibacillus multivorans TaxID=237069 RepID=A0A1G9YLG4_9BACI|nr:hypothetical protein [Tenuibacillus multivorans]GEL78461.1 hypothetical protein TMU01_26960 [Tenuibacillus multivorans]SDN09950.1 hypothetical protein SAMN05216498_1464 [Tenuibacillus multivorans]